MPKQLLSTEQRNLIQRLTSFPEERIKKANIDWDALEEIHADHIKNTHNLETAGQSIQATLQKAPGVHSAFHRTKDPNHLLAKLIRKKIESRPGHSTEQITPQNYKSKITDLSGIRALHLFKNDWAKIHEFITTTWTQVERPTINFRKGDNIDEFKQHKCKTKEHKAGYRSVHYLVAVKTTKQEVIAEIQVRTIFEEAWSEIDHTIRYPHNQDNLLLNEFLAVFNRLAGSADEMGSYIRVLQGVLTANQNTQTEKELALSNQIKKLETQIKKLEIQATKRDALLASLSDIQQSNSILLGTSVGSLFNRGASLLDVVARPQEPTINYGSLVTISGSSSGLSALVKTGDKGSPAPFISLTTSKKSSD